MKKSSLDEGNLPLPENKRNPMSGPAPTSPTERLTLLLHLTQAFNASLDLDEVLERVMDEVIAALHAERGFVMLREADGRLTFPTARGLDQHTIEAPLFEISRSVVESVAESGLPIHTSDALADGRFSGRASVRKLGLRSILCAPLKVKHKIIGVIYVENRLQAGIFTADDLDLLCAISSSAATAIENARLYLVAIEKGRMDRELEMARRVQASLLPAIVPNPPGWEFAIHWQPAREVAGDFYDFIPFPDGKIGLVIADVTDKGMPAALFMALTRSVIRATAYENPSPSVGITRANQLICAQSDQGLYVTLFFGLLDPITGEMTYVNSGHNPPLICDTSQNEFTNLQTTGIPLGIDDGVAYGQQVVQIQPGDFVLLYTDGVTEAFAPQGQEFGVNRLQKVVLALRDASPGEMISGVLQSMNDFTRNTNPSDDITMVVAKRL